MIEKYHLVIISKPGVPTLADSSSLSPSQYYLNTNGVVPPLYYKTYYTDYYVNRNIHVLEELKKKTWVDEDELVVAGHSQGSMVAALVANQYEAVTHLIYSGGNPFGRIMQMISQSRASESTEKSYTERTFEYWETVVQNKNSLESPEGGDPDKSTFDFSQNIMDSLLSLNIPVLVTYGGKDWGALFNDYLRVDTTRARKTNFKFIAYQGAEHNFFPVRKDGSINYKEFGWDAVAKDWSVWLRDH